MVQADIGNDANFIRAGYDIGGIQKPAYPDLYHGIVDLLADELPVGKGVHNLKIAKRRAALLN